MNEIVDSINKDKRKEYDFYISRVENLKDSIIVLKSGDIKRITFSSALSKQDYHDLFLTYASTLKIGKLDFYKSTLNTNVWEQFWLKRTIYQMLTFDIYVSKDNSVN